MVVNSKMKEKQSRTNALYYFSFRLSVPKDKDVCYAEAQNVELAEFFKYVLGCDKWVFQLENSHLEKTEEEKASLEHSHNLHFQCWLHCKEKKRISHLLKFFKGTTWEKWSKDLKPGAVAGRRALSAYCMKKETRVKGPWADREIYLGADLISEATMVPHQRSLLHYLRTVCPVKHGKRMSLWIYCPEGGSGKSAFKKFCAFHYKWPGFSYSKTADILYMVSKFPNKRVYFFNLSKTKSSEISEQELYAAIEAIKDGDFTSTKYECQNILMNPCHTVIFANHLPQVAKLTKKRFKVMEWDSLPDEILDDEIKWDFKCRQIAVEDVEARAKQQEEKEKFDKWLRESEKKFRSSFVPDVPGKVSKSGVVVKRARSWEIPVEKCGASGAKKNIVLAPAIVLG